MEMERGFVAFGEKRVHPTPCRFGKQGRCGVCRRRSLRRRLHAGDGKIKKKEGERKERKNDEIV